MRYATKSADYTVMGRGRNFVACRNLGQSFKTNRKQIDNTYFTIPLRHIISILVTNMHLRSLSIHSVLHAKAHAKLRRPGSLNNEYVAQWRD